MSRELETNDLKAIWQQSKKMDLASLFSYFQYIAQGLQEVVRYKRRGDIAGQSVSENDLQHSYKMAFITVVFAVEENNLRSVGDQLDIGLLATMAIIHDISEIIKGDIASFEKNTDFKDNEYEVFLDIIKILPDPVKEYLSFAFKQIVYDSKYHFDTKESRFFKAIEKLEHISRAIHECRLGKLHFAPKYADETATVLRASKEFLFLARYVSGFIKELELHEKEFEKQRGYYFQEYLKRGGIPEDFPF